MPRLMLDTNICSYIIKRRPPSLRRHFEMIDPSDVTRFLHCRRRTLDWRNEIEPLG